MNLKQPFSIAAVVCLVGVIFPCAGLHAASEPKPGVSIDAEKLRGKE